MERSLDTEESLFVENTNESGVHGEPRGEIEHAIAQIWREVFCLESVGRDDNFFELGGSSLTGMKLTEAFSMRLGLELPVVAIFQHPTIRELAQLAESPAES